jgi:hypothetical protein
LLTSTFVRLPQHKLSNRTDQTVGHVEGHLLTRSSNFVIGREDDPWVRLVTKLVAVTPNDIRVEMRVIAWFEAREDVLGAQRER